MPPSKFIKPEKIWLKNHTEYNEKWVQDIIANDPTIIGLGDLTLRSTEKKQPKAGRLDLLLEDTADDKRYEVEIQLGKSDESHIIRTIEYWDIERKRYPQYDHCAVIIAEDVTTRFLNVINLFNGHIPLIAIQMEASKVGEFVTLNFVKVLDEIQLGFEDDESDIPLVDRNYWEKKSPNSLKIVDEILQIVKEFNPHFSLKYNKASITQVEGNILNNFIRFFPVKSFLVMNVKYPKQDDLIEKLEESDLDFHKYNKKGRYKIKLKQDDVEQNKDILKWFLKLAYDNSK